MYVAKGEVTLRAVVEIRAAGFTGQGKTPGEARNDLYANVLDQYTDPFSAIRLKGGEDFEVLDVYITKDALDAEVVA